MRFKTLYRKALQDSVSDGTLSLSDYTELFGAYKRPIRVIREKRIDLMQEIESFARSRLQDVETFWSRLVAWFKANWPAILKLLLSLLLM